MHVSTVLRDITGARWRDGVAKLDYRTSSECLRSSGYLTEHHACLGFGCQLERTAGYLPIVIVACVSVLTGE